MVEGPEASLHLPPAACVPDSRGCLGRFLCGGRGPGDEEGEESLCLVGFYKDVLNV